MLAKLFQSKINLLNATDGLWPGTKICQKKDLKSPQWLRNIKTKRRLFWNIFRDKQPQLIENAGWHFSFLKSPSEIKQKIILIFLRLAKSIILTRNILNKPLSTAPFDTDLTSS